MKKIIFPLMVLMVMAFACHAQYVEVYNNGQGLLIEDLNLTQSFSYTITTELYNSGGYPQNSPTGGAGGIVSATITVGNVVLHSHADTYAYTPAGTKSGYIALSGNQTCPVMLYTNCVGSYKAVASIQYSY